jgi:hypothetical protein
VKPFASRKRSDLAPFTCELPEDIAAEQYENVALVAATIFGRCEVDSGGADVAKTRSVDESPRRNVSN